MGIQVNIGEAKTRLSELVAAAKRGEEVVIARAGQPEVRLVPIRPEEALAARRAEREKWFGRHRGKLPPDFGDSFLQPTFTDEEMDEFCKFPGEDD
jgi:prevent-host-death family protein